MTKTIMEQSQSDPLSIAKLGFKHFSHGLATGVWDDFFSMLTDDFTFSFPVGSFQGINIGKSQAELFFKYATEKVFPDGLAITIDRISQSETTVVFEGKSEGKMFGKPYQNQVAISFDIRETKICGYREYLSIAYVKEV
jgi:ketosteroid isomerase-like protein